MAKVIKLPSDQITNAAKEIIKGSEPYIVRLTIEGIAPLLFHRYDPIAVREKGEAPKGSEMKKTDDLESYLYRNVAGEICLPGEYLRQSIITAAKSRQDPRSPRKSAMDLFKAGLVSLTELASLGLKHWQFEDNRRAVVQRQAIPRTRPGINAGWEASFDLMVNIGEYITPTLLRQVVDDAGRLVGVADFRPSFGRFNVQHWQLNPLTD